MSLEVVIEHLKAKRNVWITGPGGTGKSYIAKGVLAKYPRNFVVTSTTGISAFNLIENAKTIHAFSGTKIYEFPDDFYYINNPKDVDIEMKMLVENTAYSMSEKTRNAIRNCGAIMIEEISMLSANKMDFVSEVFKIVKEDDRPFGGMRVMALGDFLQLEPVKKEDGETYLAFESKAWEELNFAVVNLTEIKRTDNLDFAMMLCDLRLGQLSDDDFFKLKKTSKNVFSEEPVRLVAMNRKADEINKLELEKLTTPKFTFKASWSGKGEPLKELKDSILAKEELVLKEGSRVMVIINDRDDVMNQDAHYFNGSLGTFLGIQAKETKRKVWQSERDPLNGNIIRRFLEYRTYMAMIIRLDTGKVISLKKHKWEWGERFTNKDGVLQAEAEFGQYPVILAHAITIHKSQGLTIPLLEIDCKGIFADNQFYVAVSRGIGFDAIRVLNLKMAHIKTSEKALEFYKKLSKDLKGDNDGELHEQKKTE